jgi:hypothetical protein
MVTSFSVSVTVVASVMTLVTMEVELVTVEVTT